MSIEKKRAVCMFCHSRCRVTVSTEEGRLVRVGEDRSYPLWNEVFPPTKACLRLRAAKEWMHHADRLSYPLKRAGERGEGKWQVIPWEVAFDEIAAKLGKLREKYGAETLGFTAGTGRTYEQFTSRFFHLFGSPNIVGQSRICFAPCISVGAALVGWPPTHRTHLHIEKGADDKPATQCILLIGIDPSQSTLRLWKGVRDGKKLGTKIIVVDPRRTQTAEIADLWLQLRPGTDTALLMSMIDVIIEEGLYDREFVEKWCYGFDRLRERAQEYPPEKAAAITRVPAEKIRAAARMYAQNAPGVTVNGMGAEHLSNAVQAIQAKFILSAIVGNLDVKGGDYIPGPARCITESELELSEKLSQEQKDKQLGSDRFRFIGWPGRDAMLPHVIKVWGKPFSMARSSAAAHTPSMYRAMITGQPYPVKALIGMASNPLVTLGNTKLIYKGLKSLELSVVADYWFTPSAEIADYVLPAASWMERPYLSTGWGTNNVIVGGEKALPASVPGEYDRKTDFEILRGLGLRLGQEEFWPWENLEESFDYQLTPLGLTFKEFMDRGGYDFPPLQFKKYEKIGFGTPTGKVELASTIFEKLGYDPLPRYEESYENPLTKPELAKEYPLMLITGGRFLPYYHSELRNIDDLRKRRPHPRVQIHPETAEKLGIKDGEWVWIESPRGRIRMKSLLFDGIDPGVVHCEHGWWFPELPGEEPWLHGVWESNVNVLTDDDPEVCNKLSGGWPLKTALCKVYPAKVY